MYRGAERVPLGPSSLLWRYAGDSRIAFMGGTVGLLQLMHPAIGAGVLDHSNFFEDPSDRVFRSLPRILGAVYDADADATSREVRDFHRAVKGTDTSGRAYHALDPETFWWAHATFQFMAEQVADRFDRHRLTDEERDQLYREGVEWFRRYGVSDRAVPETRAEFQGEWDRICCEVLAMNDAVRFVLDMLDAPRLPRFNDRLQLPAAVRTVANTRLLRSLAARPSRLAAIGGLPPVVRAQLDIPWSRQDQVQLDALEFAIARTWRFVPATARWQPAAAAGWRRTASRLP